MWAEVVTWHVNVEAYLSVWHSLWPWGCVCMWKRDSWIITLFPFLRRIKGETIWLCSVWEPLSLHGFQFRPPQHISNATASHCNLLQENWKNPRCKSVCVGPECAGWILTLLFAVSVRGQSSSLSPIWVCESCSYCNLRKEKERGKKRICRFSKAKRKDGSGPICWPPGKLSGGI